MLPLAFLILVRLSVPGSDTGAGAQGSMVQASSGPGGAFARYLQGLDRARPWQLETIEIDASLPKLKKHGRLTAIRRLLPFGKPEFQVLEMDGDATVRQQVIVRYLNAEVSAASLPPGSVAISPQNYKFRYAGSLTSGTESAYIFDITPRQKREGLIKGQLWIDANTGEVLRQSGYLVKRPSLFLKRVDLMREIEVHNGVADARVTHLSLDTRLVGRAELMIHERPCEVCVTSAYGASGAEAPSADR